MPPGISFSPFQQAQGGQQSGQMKANPVQDAIKLLSFRLPSMVGAQGIAPQQLIAGGPTALGPQIGNAIAQQHLQQMFGGQPPGGQTQDMGGTAGMMGGGMPSAPSGGSPYMDWMNQEPAPQQQAPPAMQGGNPFMDWMNQEPTPQQMQQPGPGQITNRLPVNVRFGDGSDQTPQADPFSYQMPQAPPQEPFPGFRGSPTGGSVGSIFRNG